MNILVHLGSMQFPINGQGGTLRPKESTPVAAANMDAMSAKLAANSGDGLQHAAPVYGFSRVKLAVNDSAQVLPPSSEYDSS